MIKKARSSGSLMILQSGEVGFSARVKGSSKLNGTILERIANSLDNNLSKLICVDVLSNQPLIYDIKSLAYSVIYYMDREIFEKSLSVNRNDY